MSTPYTNHSTEGLLDALEEAGRHPDLKLIAACLERPDELTPGLLTLFEASTEEQPWLEGDPRWYGPVHAGQLLLAFREPEAVPLFADLLRDSDRQTLLEWFDTDLHALGPPFVPALIEIVKDASVYEYGRSLSISTLGRIAREHPAETRGRVLEALRSELPPATPDGAPPPDRTVTYDDIEHWSWVALALAELQDEPSRPRIEDLYDAGWIDTFMVGNLDDYHATVDGELAPHDYDVDILEQYARRASFEATRDSSEPDEATSKRARQGGHYEGGTFVRDEPKVGRNDPCPCGSGRKYKHCCG